MRITVLFGSPHADGHTAALLDAFLSAYPDASVQRFDAYALAPAPCDDCGACKTGGCVKRDLDALFRACETCDMLVLASPVYHYSLPAPLKAILDRSQPWYYRNFDANADLRDGSRTGILLLTAGRSGRFAFDLIRRQATVFFRIFGLSYGGERFLPGTDGMRKEDIT